MSERDLLFATMTIIAAGTLVAFVAQWWRSRGRNDDGGPQERRDPPRDPHDPEL